MTYIPDGDPYTYMPGEEGAVAVGWLEAAEPYERGSVPAEFVERLRRICERGMNVTRGLFRCQFCRRPPGTELPPATTVTSASGGEYVVGHAEIRVHSAHGTRFAAPDMIVHYVEAHRYRPPREFVEAVLAEPDDVAYNALIRLLQGHAWEFETLSAVVGRLAADPRTFVRRTGGQPASGYLSLETKLGIAAREGRHIEGGDDLLAKLRELGGKPLSVVFVEYATQTVIVYVSPDLDVVAGCLLIDRAATESVDFT
jgi:hypothetical protein